MTTKKIQSDKNINLNEVKAFFKKVGLENEKERLEFKKFEFPEDEKRKKYEIKLTNNTQI